VLLVFSTVSDDLVLVSDSEESLMEKIRKWKAGLESKRLKVNIGKTKVMKCKLFVVLVKSWAIIHAVCVTRVKKIIP